MDVGASHGESLTAFKTTELYKKYPWKIIAIEPDPVASATIPRAHDVEVIAKAAWTYNGEISFFQAIEKDDTRNSVFNMPKINKVKVSWPCFDFSQWVSTHFDPNDYVILSLDVAGAEPTLLKELLKSGAIDRIDRLYVEISYEMLAKGPQEQVEVHADVFNVLEKIRAKGILFDSDSVEDVIAERYSWEDEI